jgi:hypothetical protein
MSCSVDGCEKPVDQSGLCAAHRTRRQRYGDPLGGGKPRPRLGDYWDYVDKSGECWIWTGPLAHFGYGVYKKKRAHRIAFEMVHGPIPPGVFILHSCDNPPCVNPAHLRMGTQRENMEDRADRGRKPTGEASRAWARSSLTPDDIRAIRADPRSGGALAPTYGVSRATIGDIRRRRSWAWVV